VDHQSYAADWINHLKLARDMSMLKNINLQMTEDDYFGQYSIK